MYKFTKNMPQKSKNIDHEHFGETKIKKKKKVDKQN